MIAVGRGRIGLHDAPVGYGGPLAFHGCVSSRQEEKERRRQERLEREQAEASARRRRKRLQLAVGGLLALAAVAGIVVAVVVRHGRRRRGQDRSAPERLGRGPAQQDSDIKEAAKAAGCTLSNPAYEGATHEQKTFKPSDYKTNPPTSGNHTPTWYEDGVYDPGNAPNLGMHVHTLEHGRIDVQYKPGTPRRRSRSSRRCWPRTSDGYHMLLFQNTTEHEGRRSLRRRGRIPSPARR